MTLRMEIENFINGCGYKDRIQVFEEESIFLGNLHKEDG